MARKSKATIAAELLANELSNTQQLEAIVATDKAEVEHQADEALEAAAKAEMTEVPRAMLTSLVQDLLAAEAKAEPVPKAKVVKQEKNQGVGTMVKQLILEGLSNKDILVKLEEMYRNKNTTYACVAWYRNKMKQTGVVVKQQAALSWVQEFAKRTGLSEEAVAELSRKVA